jgi:hypothetical protein
MQKYIVILNFWWSSWSDDQTRVYAFDADSPDSAYNMALKAAGLLDLPADVNQNLDDRVFAYNVVAVRDANGLIWDSNS